MSRTMIPPTIATQIMAARGKSPVADLAMVLPSLEEGGIVCVAAAGIERFSSFPLQARTCLRPSPTHRRKTDLVELLPLQTTMQQAVLQRS